MVTVKADHTNEGQKIETPDEEIQACMRGFAELIFDAWREQRSIRVGKTENPEPLQADGRSQYLKSLMNQDRNGLA
jgi:hypothetical protein